MIRFRTRGLLVSATLAVLLVVPGVARADVLNDWNVIAQSEAVLIRPTAHGQTRGMAMVQGAVYDAVNALDPRYEPYLLDLAKLKAQPFGSRDVAIATAAHNVLVAIVDPTRVAALDAAYAKTLEPIQGGPTKDEGIRVGAAAASAMLAARATDGYMAPFTFDLRPDAGWWRPLTATATDPDAWVGNLKPFAIESPSQFRSKGPNALTSPAYTRDFDEVKSVGALKSTTRTADQTTAAIFWQAAPAAIYNRLARDLSAARGLDTSREARLLAMMNLAAADGAISCWNDKYHWNFWRPRAAIQEAANDGNPNTVPDPTWEPLFHPSTATTPALVTPPFPDHPSGHGCVSGAVFRVFREVFGTDKVSFDVFSSRFPTQPRHFDRFSLALKEIVDARVWGGIHFRTADVQGAGIGKKVGFWLQKHYFTPLRPSR
ncbi:MAG TPA: vanadium-dependent haloperoxidase [Candidatus Limnocylindrales bacterium]|nr:vanadium-dependent haloperoxidase [Candidatus Limnocylindrales bacterium]